MQKTFTEARPNKTKLATEYFQKWEKIVNSYFATIVADRSCQNFHLLIYQGRIWNIGSK